MSKCAICGRELDDTSLTNGDQHYTHNGTCICKACAESIVNSRISVADELTKLKTLLDQGVLTQAEFEAQKKKLLGTTDTPAIPAQPKFDCQKQINPPDPASKVSEPIKKKKKLHIVSWFGVAFFGMLGLVFLPSAFSVVALLMVVYLCPVNAIRSRRDKWIPNALLRVLLGCLLFIALIIATPTNSSESGSEAEVSAAPKNSTVETAAASIPKSNTVKATDATVPKNTVAETVPTTAATEPPSPYESVFYIDFVNNISDYDGKKVEITVPVDTIYSDGDISVSTSSKISKRISIETGKKEYYDKEDNIQFVTVRGIAKNNSSDIEIRKTEVIYAGPDAPDSYKKSLEEYEALIVQGKLAVRDEFIRNASSVSFESLRRNPDSHNGKPLKMTIQVNKVDVDGMIFNGAVWATYDGHRIIVYDNRENREPRLMAGDTITIYAEGNGLSKIKTYEKGTGLFGTDLGANVVNEEEVPSVNMKYTNKEDVSKYTADTYSLDDSQYYNNKGRELAEKLNKFVGD